jgi:hypothetical protein
MYYLLELKDKTLMLSIPSTATWYNLINGAFNAWSSPVLVQWLKGSKISSPSNGWIFITYINSPSSTKKVLVHYHSTYSLTKALETSTIYKKLLWTSFWGVKLLGESLVLHLKEVLTSVWSYHISESRSLRWRIQEIIFYQPQLRRRSW